MRTAMKEISPNVPRGDVTEFPLVFHRASKLDGETPAPTFPSKAV